MFGCCGKESSKFKAEDGKIDIFRLDAVLESIQDIDFDKEMYELFKSEVSLCDCLCHQDGLSVLC